MSGQAEKVDVLVFPVLQACLKDGAVADADVVEHEYRGAGAGGGLIRGKLFTHSFLVKKTNVACAALFDRLVAKGKNKKLVPIAVCNKLLKQTFAIVKCGVPYQADFSSKLVPTA